MARFSEETGNRFLLCDPITFSAGTVVARCGTRARFVTNEGVTNRVALVPF